MRILVTGGAGYIGSVTVNQLLDEGWAVTVFDNLENGHRAAVDPRAVLVEGDLRREEDIAAVLSAGFFDGVIHFAGYIESGQSMTDPLRFFKNNLSAGINLLAVMQERGVRNIIFSSTAGIYGTGQPPFTEESPVNTTSYYSMSKYFFEEALRAVSHANGFKVTALRYFNAAGALKDGSLGEDHHPETHLIPLVIGTALGRRPVQELYGTDYPTPDGTAVRDYIHVEDLAEVHILALKRLLQKEKGQGFFEIYNVGTGQGYSNRQVIAMVKEVAGCGFEIVEKPRRAGDWAVSFADSAKIKKYLGWTAKRGLREIVESAYLWHKNHPQGYKEEQQSNQNRHSESG